MPRLSAEMRVEGLIDESHAGRIRSNCQALPRPLRARKRRAAAGPITSRQATDAVRPSWAVRAEPRLRASLGDARDVRVLCPYCKASFKRRVPRTLRGLPARSVKGLSFSQGDLKPSGRLRLNNWSRISRANPPRGVIRFSELRPRYSGQESNTRRLVKKYERAHRRSAQPPRSTRPALSA